MIRAMVFYPTLRLEPSEDGPRLRLYWVVRGAARHSDGWMTGSATAQTVLDLGPAWRIIRVVVHSEDPAGLMRTLRRTPGLRVTGDVTGPNDTKENG